MFKYHSDMGHGFSKVVAVSKIIFFFFTFLNWENHGIRKNVAIFDGNGAEIWPLKKGRKSPEDDYQMMIIFWCNLKDSPEHT